MCVTIILHKKLKEYPLIIGNNRDEMVERKFVPPQIINTTPLIFAPKDLERGGTWLGINENKIVINILNKWTGNKNFFGSKNYISRGELVVNLLKEQKIDNIISKIEKINKNKFLPFHLLIANREKAYVIIKNEDISIHEITGKTFIIGNLNPFNDWEKYKFGYEFIKKHDFSTIKSIEKNLKKLLKYHKGDKNIPSSDYAVDLGDFKTTSSTLLFVNNEIIFKFLNGFPGKSKYKIFKVPF